uniref:Uncharacterized protein n=1 Tax=Parascaris univalens TaxID=6257 RepID=A0A915A6D6_PARUN
MGHLWNNKSIILDCWTKKPKSPKRVKLASKPAATEPKKAASPKKKVAKAKTPKKRWPKYIPLHLVTTSFSPAIAVPSTSVRTSLITPENSAVQ